MCHPPLSLCTLKVHMLMWHPPPCLSGCQCDVSTEWHRAPTVPAQALICLQLSLNTRQHSSCHSFNIHTWRQERKSLMSLNCHAFFPPLRSLSVFRFDYYFMFMVDLLFLITFNKNRLMVKVDLMKLVVWFIAQRTENILQI